MKKPVPQKAGQRLPEAIIYPESCKAVADMAPGSYGWTSVWADSDNHAFVMGSGAIREAQGEFWPHFLLRTLDGFHARLMTQRVQRLDADVSKWTDYLPVETVEL